MLFVFDFVDWIVKLMDVLIDGPVSVRLKVNGCVPQSTNQSIKIEQSINESNQHSSNQSDSQSKNSFVIKQSLHDPIKYIKESTNVMTGQV